MAKLFGSSGVRGLANVDLTPQLACKVGLAVAAYAKAKKVVVARDTRVSGSMIEDALVSGFFQAAPRFYLAGMVPTPALAYATKVLGAMLASCSQLHITRHNITASKFSEQTAYPTLT